MEVGAHGSFEDAVRNNQQLLDMFKTLVLGLLAYVGGLDYSVMEKIEDPFETIREAAQRQQLLDRMMDGIPCSVGMYEEMTQRKGIQKIQDFLCLPPKPKNSCFFLLHSKEQKDNLREKNQKKKVCLTTCSTPKTRNIVAPVV